MDIISKHKDEEIVVDILLQDKSGTPVANPASLVVSVVISDSAGGDALNATRYDATIQDAAAARFRRVLSPSDLSGLTEGLSYHYNIWSKEGTAAPVLRAKGKISLQPSISLPA